MGSGACYLLSCHAANSTTGMVCQDGLARAMHCNGNLRTRGMTSEYFRLFNEIGIIRQLSRTLLEARLPLASLQPSFPC